MMHQIAPAPNLNGSKADDLAEQMLRVSSALNNAIGEMLKWQPHGRDYQIGGDYQADRAEYLRRIGLVEALSRQYEREAIAVSEYNDKKARA